MTNWRWEIVLVDLVKDKVELCRNLWDICLDEVNKDVDGIGIDSGTFMTAGMEDGGAYVARERVKLRRGRFGWVMLCWDRLGV